jgi:peptide/nickel transport system permease protein
MIRFILRRLFYGLLVLWGVVTIIFFLFNVLPGDPARMLLGQRSDVSSVEAITKDLGLDKPLGLQYIKFLNDLSPISFHNFNKDNSYWYYKSSDYGKSVQLIPISDIDFFSRNSQLDWMSIFDEVLKTKNEIVFEYDCFCNCDIVY